MPPKRKAQEATPGPKKAAKASSTSTPRKATPKNVEDTERDPDTIYDLDADVSEAQRKKEKELEQAGKKFEAAYAASSDRFKSQDEDRKNKRTSCIFKERDFSYLRLKPDHKKRPLWIDPDRAIVTLERFNPLAEKATDFLVTIAEPLSRPTFVHEYTITTHSLYAAVSAGLKPQDIIEILDRFLKTELPSSTKNFILSRTKSYGKVKLVLKQNKYFVESADASVLQKLLKDKIIGKLRVQGSTGITTTIGPTTAGVAIAGTKDAAGVRQAELNRNEAKDADADDGEAKTSDKADAAKLHAALEDDDDDDGLEAIHSFEIPDAAVEKVQKRCLDLEYPILEEYDFRHDNVNPNLDIDLRPNTQIRHYQEKSLSKMFGNGRAKSGIIVLPCGAGKTLVGITAACTIKKGVVVLCTSSVSAVQWRNEFLKWSNVPPESVVTFTAGNKTFFEGSTGIVVTTYSMVTNNHSRTKESQKMLDKLTSREWGLMLLDEVHVTPAEVFRRVISSIKSHSKLGLTATLLREDDKISHLNFLIGPKLYEANWMELSQQGHIAKVECAEVWCPMPPEFLDTYQQVSSQMKQTLCAVNPRKFQVCQYLIEYHEKRGDKIIVFSDDIYSLKLYALKMQKAFIHGGTSQQERLDILENFRHNPVINTLFLSKIGDTSLDLPEATCLIQVSAQFGSRRQEAQRLGRILRAKRRNDEGFNAFFYSLVSKDTQEMRYASKRQRFLVDQGYAFKVITKLQSMEMLPDLAFSTEEERKELLRQTLAENDKEVVKAAKEEKKKVAAKERARKKLGSNPFFKNVRAQQKRMAAIKRRE